VTERFYAERHRDSCGIRRHETGQVVAFEAIPVRQCSRSIYDGRPLSAKELRVLEDVAHGDGVHATCSSAPPQIETVLDYVTCGKTAQIGDRAFVDELKTWIRFNEAEAVRTRGGLFFFAAKPELTGSHVLSGLVLALLRTPAHASKAASQSVAGIVVGEKNRCVRISAPAAWSVAGSRRFRGLAGTISGTIWDPLDKIAQHAQSF
jgi:hypothetical protein